MRANAAAAAALGGRDGARSLEREWAAILQHVPLFDSLSKRHLRRVASCARMRRFERGAAIVRTGATGGTFYVLLEGEAAVSTPRGRGARLRVGDYFGEMALLDGAPRSADVHAVTDVVAMEIGNTAFLRLLKQEPQIALALLRALAARVRRLEG